MKWSHSVPWSESTLPAAVWPPTRWADWMPGITVTRAEQDEVELAVGGPLPHGVVVEASHTSTRLSVQQLDGRARHLGLTLAVVDGTLIAELEVDWPQNIPGSLRRELREHWLQSALQQLSALG